MQTTSAADADADADAAVSVVSAGVGARRHLSLRTKALIVIYLSVGVDAIGLSMSIPIMPFFVEELGGHATAAGVIQGVFNAMQILSSLWMGMLSDRISRRIVLLLSIAGSAVFMLLSAFCTTVFQLLVMRALLGLFSGSFPVGEAFIASIVSGEDRPRYMAMLGACNGLVFMLAPPLGSLLAASPIGLLAPFYVGSAGSVCALVYGYFNLPNQQEVEAARLAEAYEADEDPKRARARLRWVQLQRTFLKARRGSHLQQTRWTSVTLICMGAIILGAVQMTFVSTAPFYVQAVFGWDESEVGVMMSLMGISAIFSQLLLFARIVKLVGVYLTGAVGSVLLAFGLLVFILPWDSSTLSAAVLLSGNVFGGMGFIIGQSAVSPSLANVSSPLVVGTVVGFGAMSASFGRIIGPIVWNAIFQFVDHKAPFATAAVVMVCVGMPFFIATHLYERHVAITEAIVNHLQLQSRESKAAFVMKEMARRDSIASVALSSPPSAEAADALRSAMTRLSSSGSLLEISVKSG